jgi:hypothetical protein
MACHLHLPPLLLLLLVVGMREHKLQGRVLRAPQLQRYLRSQQLVVAHQGRRGALPSLPQLMTGWR